MVPRLLVLICLLLAALPAAAQLSAVEENCLKIVWDLQDVLAGSRPDPERAEDLVIQAIKNVQAAERRYKPSSRRMDWAKRTDELATAVAALMERLAVGQFDTKAKEELTRRLKALEADIKKG